jgi:hypothetical protein
MDEETLVSVADKRDDPRKIFLAQATTLHS